MGIQGLLKESLNSYNETRCEYEKKKKSNLK